MKKKLKPLPPQLRHLAQRVERPRPSDEVAAQLAELDARIATAQQAEARAENAQKALRAALEDAHRNRSKPYTQLGLARAENARQRQAILTLQAELADLRQQQKESIGFDKADYFARLGADLLAVGTEIQQIGERLEGEAPDTRHAAERLQFLGEVVWNFAANAQAYADEAENADA